MKRLLIALLLTLPFQAQAALFRISYDDTPTSDPIFPNPLSDIVGTGLFGYDGAATIGSFVVSELNNVTFSAQFVGGQSFSTGDITDTAGISVFSLEGGSLGLVFTGSSTFGGSFGLVNAFDDTLGHEPTYAVGERLGCCGGNGTENEYSQASLILGDPRGVAGSYAAVSVPEPATLGMLGAGLLTLGVKRRRRAA